MGSRYSVYVGPYVRCVNRTVTNIRRMKSCTNTECATHGKYNDNPFCSACGSAAGETDVKRQGWAVDADDVDDTLRNRLRQLGGWDQPIDLWVGNISWGSRSRHAFENDVGELVDGNDQHEEITAFTAFFGKDIATLKTAYGDDSVEVKWGAIGDWS